MRIVLKNMGNLIKERRKVLGLIQAELAKISGISTRTIQLIEQGKMNPSLETLVKVIVPLAVTIELVLKDTSKSNYL